MTETLTATTFNEVISASTKPVVVDFWAEWCPPCRAIAPVLSEIAEEYSDTIQIAKVNVDEYPELAKQFDVASIPTLIIFSDGQPVDRLVGARGKAQLLEDLTPYV